MGVERENCGSKRLGLTVGGHEEWYEPVLTCPDCKKEFMIGLGAQEVEGKMQWFGLDGEPRFCCYCGAGVELPPYDERVME